MTKCGKHWQICLRIFTSRAESNCSSAHQNFSSTIFIKTGHLSANNTGGNYNTQLWCETRVHNTNALSYYGSTIASSNSGILWSKSTMTQENLIVIAFTSTGTVESTPIPDSVPSSVNSTCEGDIITRAYTSIYKWEPMNSSSTCFSIIYIWKLTVGMSKLNLF